MNGIDAILMGDRGKAYVFRGAEVIRYDVAADRALGPAEPIAATWPGLWSDGIDAAVNWRNGKAFFFKGAEYIRYDLSSDRADDGYPLPIAPHWPGLWPDRIDAILMGDRGKAYVFRGAEVIRYDVAADRALGPAEPIAANWPGLWSDGIDAAVNWRNGKAFFFKGAEYIRYDLSSDRADDGYPLPIAPHWPGLWPDLGLGLPGVLSPGGTTPTPVPAGPGGQPAPHIAVDAGSRVTPLIRAAEYFPRVRQAMADVKSGGYILVAGWQFEPSFDFAGSGTRLIDLLRQRARDGVDVRLLGWAISPQVTGSGVVALLRRAGRAGGIDGVLDRNEGTIKVVKELRAEPSIGFKACLNTMAHPAGAAHMKFVMIGDDDSATVFTGGMDLHGWAGGGNWYDIQLEATGPIASDCHRAYAQLWNELVSRPVETVSARTESAPSHDASTPRLDDRIYPLVPVGTRRATSVRTLPAFRLTGGALGVPTARPLSFAPNGATDVADALRTLCGTASTYIYLEDQYFSSRDVMDWLNAALRERPELRVVLVTGRVDPSDPNTPLKRAYVTSINDHLLRGLAGDPNDRVAFFRHRTHIVHAKSALVDDRVAIIGSANWARRGMFTDIEHSLRYEDPVAGLGADRQKIWGHHLGASAGPIAAAVDEWFAIPIGTTHATLDRYHLPLPPSPLSAAEEWELDVVVDADSRQSWPPVPSIPVPPIPVPPIPTVPLP